MIRRLRWREVTPSAPRPCYWCPEPIEAGHQCDCWAAVDSGGSMRTRWAHTACDREARDEIAEGLGDDDIPPEPDQGCIPRMIGFWPERDDFEREVAAHHEARDRDVWMRLWDRVHGPVADLAELAGVRS